MLTLILPIHYTFTAGPLKSSKLPKGSLKALQLIKYDGQSKKLVIDQEALSLIRKVNKPVAVLSICGPARTGKSYFMSKAVNSDVFPVSHEYDPCTKGIWMSPVSADKDDMEIIFLDTEGMDAPQSDQNLDGEVEMFVILTVLLSSYLIYNTQGPVSKASLENLGLVMIQPLQSLNKLYSLGILENAQSECLLKEDKMLHRIMK